MSTYIAIIKDSFREAKSSKLLWVTFILIFIGLAMVMLFGIHERPGTEFESNKITKKTNLKIDTVSVHGENTLRPYFIRINTTAQST